MVNYKILAILFFEEFVICYLVNKYLCFSEQTCFNS